MRDKYIIELEDKPFHNEDGDFLYRAKGFNSLVFDMTGIGKMTPYTEPDIEQVKADAYLKGLNDGQGVIFASTQNNAFNNGYKKCLEDWEQVRKEERDRGYDDGYHQGLSDAWEAATKILKANWRERNGTFGAVTLLEDIFLDNTPAEAIEKIRQYEQELENEFKVGDEFENESGKKFVVLKMNGKEIDRYIDCDGGTYHMNVKYRVMRKTGRHFPEIAAFLEKMRGENND